MNDQELERRLRSLDPAQPRSSLAAVVDKIVEVPRSAPRAPSRTRGFRIAAIAGGTIIALGAVVAFTDLDSYLLSIPPFSTLDEGTVRTSDGLAYIPLSGGDQGEQCAIWVDVAGLSPDQFSAINNYWSHADPALFAAGVAARFETIASTADAEELAKRQQLLSDLGRVVPGLEWGSAAPGHPWPVGDPHLTAFSTVCTSDTDSTQ